MERLKQALDSADAVVIGAGAGLSASAGLTYSGERFETHFKDFARKYGIQDMYSGGFYPFATLEEYWAWWSRHIMINRYERAPRPVYDDLLKLVAEKDYFVLTTNVDHQFQKAGFDKHRLFYTQGDYGLPLDSPLSSSRKKISLYQGYYTQPQVPKTTPFHPCAVPGIPDIFLLPCASPHLPQKYHPHEGSSSSAHGRRGNGEPNFPEPPFSARHLPVYAVCRPLPAHTLALPPSFR